jgi:signal transduction histidine kinase
MGWTLTSLSVVVFASAIVSLVVGIVALRRRPDPMAWPIALLGFTAVAWAVPHAISFGYTDVGRVTDLYRVLQIAATVVPVAYFVVALKYAGYDRWLRPAVYALLSVGPAVTAVALLSNGVFHTLFWESVAVEQVGAVTVFSPEVAPLYWANLAHGYLFIGLAFVIFASVALSSETIYRKQSVLMFLGGLVPTLVNIPTALGADIAPPVDLTSASLAVSGVMFAVALFRYDLLDLSPAAYRNVPDTFGDGVLVFDGEKRLVEANDHARRILDTEPETGMEAGDLFESPVEEIDGTVMTTTEEFRRFYDVRYSPLEDHREAVVGHAVVMREVTDLKDHEQRLSVTNRILRHNLRNELTIILGETDQLDGGTLASAGSVERINAAARRLQDVSEKARHIQTSMRFDEELLVSYDLVPVVETVIARYREAFPEADLTLDAPDRAVVLAGDRRGLETVVRNVIENALEHNDSDHPQVTVTIRRIDEDVRLSVADNGPGIPSAEREILRDGHETQLEHGSSIGLWLVYWLVSAIGGDISFEDRKPRGTVVTLEFRGAEEPPADPDVVSEQRPAAGVD